MFFRSSRSRTEPKSVPMFDTLESRTLLSGVTASVDKGVLNITGTSRADEIRVVVKNKAYKVQEWAGGGWDTITKVIPRAVKRIHVNAKGGNDEVIISQDIKKDTKILGGPGNDRLLGGGGSDTIKGGAGNDSIVGRTGNDLLYGDAGDDGIFGSAGDDYIVGGAGMDACGGQSGSDIIDIQDGYTWDAVQGGSGRDTVIYDRSDFDMDGLLIELFPYQKTGCENFDDGE